MGDQNKNPTEQEIEAGESEEQENANPPGEDGGSGGTNPTEETRNETELALEQIENGTEENGQSQEADKGAETKPGAGAGDPGTGEAEKEANGKQPTEAKTALPDDKGGQAKPEDDETLIRSISSQRGQDRIRKLLSEGKVAITRFESIQKLVKDSGLDEQGLTNLLSLSRLCSSDVADERRRGLEMLERVREELYRSCGVDIPGADPLSGFPDIQKRVSEMTLSKEDALEIARARRMKADQERMFAEQEQRIARRRSYTQSCENAKLAMETAFKSREQDLDFKAKVAAITERFKNPAEMQRFITTFRPDQWASALMYMYDNMAVQRPQQQVAAPIAGAQKLRQGTPARKFKTDEEMYDCIMKDMGI